MMRVEIDMLVLDEEAVLEFLRLPCRYLDIFSNQKKHISYLYKLLGKRNMPE
jgi:hypothetical protein